MLSKINILKQVNSIKFFIVSIGLLFLIGCNTSSDEQASNDINSLIKQHEILYIEMIDNWDNISTLIENITEELSIKNFNSKLDKLYKTKASTKSKIDKLDPLSDIQQIDLDRILQEKII